MSFSPIPGAIVPVSEEVYATSAVGTGRDGTGGSCPCLPAGRSMLLGCAGAGAGGAVAAGAGAGWGLGALRCRAASIFAFTIAHCSLICLHPEVAIVTSAHIHSVLRRMSSLHRVKDARTILAAQRRGGAPLRVRHEPDHVPAGVADARDVARRAVRVVAHVPPHDPLARLELGAGARVHDVAAV